jgi:hypothetical protein
LTEDEQTELEKLVRTTTMEQRTVQRARMVLAAAAGKAIKGY